MTQYLLSIMQPDGPPPDDEFLAPIIEDLRVLRKDMKAAGEWVFSGGLHPPTTATVMRPENGSVLMTDGPYTEGHEHLGGFTIVEVPDLDAALEWGRRLALATTLPVEVRPLYHN